MDNFSVNVLPIEDRIYEGPRPSGIRAEFYLAAVADPAASAAAGRQIFRNAEMVRIYIPGSVTNQHVKYVDEEAKRRWPREYEAFKAGVEAPPEGTPIEQWPVLLPAQVQELKYFKIRTVEEVAELSDQALQGLGNNGMGARNLRDHARAFLKKAERLALTSQLTQENDMLRSRVAGLEAQVSELGRLFERLDGERRVSGDRASPLASTPPALADPIELLKMVMQAAMQGGQMASMAPQAAAPLAQVLMPPKSAFDGLGPPVRDEEDEEEAGLPAGGVVVPGVAESSGEAAHG
jgi:hypothetical protein